MPDRDFTEVLSSNPELVILKAGIVNRCLNIVDSVATLEAGNAIIFNCSVSNISFSAVALGDVNPVVGEAKDIASFNEQRLASEPADAIDSGANAVEPEISQNHNIRRSGLDHDAVGAADQDGSDLSATAVNGDGFGDSKGAVSGWIKRVNFAAGGSLGDCARKRFAWGSAAAGVNIIAHTGHPSPGGLGSGEAGPQ
ncbi:MAG TPA: hypothetical protein VE176_06045 [Candidatus Limnocylindrales bacterium]|nr:hypothetical protein [Candidatus Limnocylindrales bacterium]